AGERSARRLPLHALARRAELPGPRWRWRGPEAVPAATRGQQLPVPGGPGRLPERAPERRTADPRRAAAVMERLPELRAVHARPRSLELAGPDALSAAPRAADLRPPGRRDRPELAAADDQAARMRAAAPRRQPTAAGGRIVTSAAGRGGCESRPRPIDRFRCRDDRPGRPAAKPTAACWTHGRPTSRR